MGIELPVYSLSYAECGQVAVAMVLLLLLLLQVLLQCSVQQFVFLLSINVYWLVRNS